MEASARLWTTLRFTPSRNDCAGGFQWTNPDIPANHAMNVGSGQLLPRVRFAYRLSRPIRDEHVAGDPVGSLTLPVFRGGYGQSPDPNQWHYLRDSEVRC
jgi:hypothetical protein